MVSTSFLFGVVAVAASASSVSADAQNGRVSIRVHKGDVTVKILPHSKALIDGQWSPYTGKNGEVCKYDRDVDYSGNDVTSKPSKDYQGCNDLCIDLSGCATWTWSDHNGGTCWLKSRIGAKGAKQGAVSLTCEYKEASADGDKQCKPFQELDFVGNDIGNVRGRQNACCRFCANTKGCGAYSWNQDNGGTCYLKSGVGETVYKQGVVSASMGAVNGGLCATEFNKDFVGSDIGNKPAKDASECCRTCKSTSGCKAFSWNNHNGGTCWMKSNRGKVEAKNGVTSAVIVF